MRVQEFVPNSFCKYGFVVIATFVSIVSCTHEKKTCDFRSDNLELVIYNNVLTELIEDHMQSMYLGGREIEILDRFNIEDSIEIQNELAKAQNTIFKDPTKFCALILDTVGRPVSGPWSYLDTAKGIHDVELKQLITQYTDNGQAAIDSLNAIQTSYSREDFGLCTSVIKNYRDLDKNDTTICVFGRLRLSKIVLDRSKEKGLLYYDWHCGELCGHRGFILFERKGDRYSIKKQLIDAVY